MASYRAMSLRPKVVTVAAPPPRPPRVVVTTGCRNNPFMLSTSSHAERYDIRMLRAAALIDPSSWMVASNRILPGPRGRRPCR